MARTADYDAPLAKWRQSGDPFERLAQCQQAREQVLDQALRDEQEYHRRQDPKQRPSTQFGFATCVASDDPRLK